MSHRVVIIGGGFGGVRTAQHLKRAPVDITLIDRRNYHLFQPLLYQVATGGLSPANIASPLRLVFRRQKNVRVIMGEAIDVDDANQRVILRDDEVPYDTLIVATGVWHQYFGHDDWAPLAPGLKSIEDATEIRSRILIALEAAERETDPAKRAAWLTFVVVGGGPTGVELAGTLGEMTRHTLHKDFRSIDPAQSRILLVEGTHRALSSFPEKLSAKAEASLNRLGVTLRANRHVTDVKPAGVVLGSGENEEFIPCRTVLWAAGVKASPMGQVLAQATGVELDRSGRVMVEPDLSLPGHPSIFVIGDLAHYQHHDGKPLPGVAPVAMQQGAFVARLIQARVKQQTLPVFKYHDLGNMATIGRNSAVVDLHWIRMSGFCAWVVWLCIHLVNITIFENRILVMMQWAWNYLTCRRSALLITGKSADQLVERD